jgi:hypothetical protein
MKIINKYVKKLPLAAFIICISIHVIFAILKYQNIIIQYPESFGFITLGFAMLSLAPFCYNMHLSSLERDPNHLSMFFGYFIMDIMDIIIGILCFIIFFVVTIVGR